MILLLVAQPLLAGTTKIPAHAESLEALIWQAQESELPALERRVVAMLQEDPHSGFAHYLLSQILLQMFTSEPYRTQLIKQAAQLAQQATDLEPDAEFGYIGLATVLEIMGFGSRGLLLLEQLPKERPSVTFGWRTLFTRARLSLATESMAIVLDLYRKALKYPGSDHNVIIPHVASALSVSETGSDLIRQLDAWQKEFPHPRFRLLKARSLFQLGKYQDASRLFNEFRGKSPFDVEAQINNAITLAKHLHNPARAQGLLEPLLGRTDVPSGIRAIAAYELGEVQLLKKHPETAAKFFSVAYAEPGHSASVLDRARQAYLKAGAARHMLAWLEILADQDNPSVSIFVTKGEILSEQLGNHSAALRALDDALTIEPERGDVHVAVGLAHYRMKSLEPALESFARAATINPSDSTATYNIACILSLMGRTRDALRFLQRAVTLDPRLTLVAERDADFSNIRSTPDFAGILSAVDPVEESAGTQASH